MTSHEVEIFTGATEMRDRILAAGAAAANGVKKLRLYGFNFGNTSARLIADLSQYLTDDFEIEALAWDTRLTRLKSRTDADVATLLKANNAERAYNVLNSVIDSDDDYSVSDTFAELLMLGSDVLITKQRHKDLLAGTARQIQETFSDPDLQKRMGYIRMRIVPNYVPAMCVILDEKIFVRLYTSKFHQVCLAAPSSSELYTHLNEHFDEVWDKATDIFGVPMGRGAEEEMQSRQHKAFRSTEQTDIFISYRRNDAGWAAAALHDRLSMAFGMEKVFLDHRTIRETKDWDAELERALRTARVFIPLLGPNWDSAENVASLTTNPNDMVRFEFEQALAAVPEKVILPVLVGRQDWPSEQQFPQAIQDVLRKQSRQRMAFETYHRDVGDIINLINRSLS